MVRPPLLQAIGWHLPHGPLELYSAEAIHPAQPFSPSLPPPHPPRSTISPHPTAIFVYLLIVTRMERQQARSSTLLASNPQELCACS